MYSDYAFFSLIGPKCQSSFVHAPYTYTKPEATVNALLEKIFISTERKPPVNTGSPPGTVWPVLSAPSLSTGQAVPY